jgi:hypothetical protein
MTARAPIAALALALVACGAPVANAPERRLASEPSSGGDAPSAPLAAGGAPAPDAASAIPARRLSLSSAGGCWLRAERVWCWNGTPAELEGSSPRAIALPAPAREVAGTLRFGCALASGGVWCWGDNTFGQLGAASRALASETPLAVPGLDGATRIAVAAEHACAALADGTVACWGNNGFGQCGHDREYAPAVRQLVRPERVEGVRGARDLAATATATCALGERDTWCWGELLRGGDGSAPATDRTRATRIAPLARARAVGLAAECGCALAADGAVACFALGPSGCAGPDLRAGIEPLFGWNDVRALAVGERGACAARRGGIECWSHAARPPNDIAGAAPRPRLLRTAGSGVPVLGDGPCVLDGQELVCWSSSFWDAGTPGAPLRIRLP